MTCSHTIVEVRVHQVEYPQVEPVFGLIHLGFGYFHQDEEPAREQERAEILCSDGAASGHVCTAIIDDVQRTGEVTRAQR